MKWLRKEVAFWYWALVGAFLAIPALFGGFLYAGLVGRLGVFLAALPRQMENYKSESAALYNRARAVNRLLEALHVELSASFAEQVRYAALGAKYRAAGLPHFANLMYRRVQQLQEAEKLTVLEMDVRLKQVKCLLGALDDRPPLLWGLLLTEKALHDPWSRDSF